MPVDSLFGGGAVAFHPAHCPAAFRASIQLDVDQGHSYALIGAKVALCLSHQFTQKFHLHYSHICPWVTCHASPSFSSKQSSHQTKQNNKKLPSTGFKQQPICSLSQQGTKSSTKQLPPTDPILGSENFLKTGFAQKEPPLPFRLKPKRCASATPIQQTSKNEPKHGPRNGTAWRRTEEARPDFNWLSGSQKWNLKAHMWYQLSPFPGSNAAIAIQHHPGNIHQSVATPRYSAAPCFNSIIQYNWHGKDGGVREPSMLHLPTSFPKQTLTPSRFKFILLGNSGKQAKTVTSFTLSTHHYFTVFEGWKPFQPIKYCGETSAWPGTCANFNPTNLAPPKHHARLRCASFGWHVLQRKSYPHGQAMPQKHWSKNAKVLGQKKLCWKCWGKKSLRSTRKSHIGTLLPRDVSLHDCRHIEIDA